MVDYSEIYDGYWKRPDRMGESSFDDPGPIVTQILSASGSGTILDIGCGMGALVRELLKQGADAYGLDVSAVAAGYCSRYARGRFFTGSILNLPLPDGSFDTLVSTDCLEHLAPDDVPTALQEMHRVCRRHLFLRVATTADRDRRWHLTVKERAWWEQAAFASGFRKHSAYYSLIPYASLEQEGNTITIPLEKIQTTTIAHCALAELAECRDLHMDMSRETGRRSDAHMARYELAARFVRDGDTIIDAACGMGYGSWMLARQSNAEHVIGIDLDAAAIQYATDNFETPGRRLSFCVADAQQLEVVPDNSVDVVVSFETLEHVPEPERLIENASRVLRPGGRFIASVPNIWVNEEGVDPNPHHLHVYDWQRIRREICAKFLLEVAFCQVAGGGMKHTSSPRSLTQFMPEEGQPSDAEWWLVIAMKDPLASDRAVYRETAFHWKGEPPNIVAFERDYANPWLVRAFVSIGWRNTNVPQTDDMARQILATAPVGSVDAGAALCVTAYRLLDSPNQLTPSEVEAIADKIAIQITASRAEPQCQRWLISLLYVQGLLWQAVGDRRRALESLTACASSDPLVYSPLLATKTVDAFRLVGNLHFQSGDSDAAKESWERGILEARRAMGGDWREIFGEVARPFFFGLREAAQILDIASRCADNLNHVAIHGVGRGLPNGWSFAYRLESLASRVASSDARWQQAIAALNELHASPAVRLHRALHNDDRSLRNIARIAFLLAIILLPSRSKSLLRPIANTVRRIFARN